MKIQRKHDTLDVSLKAMSVQLPAKSFSGCFFKQTTLHVVYGASYNGWTDKAESSTPTQISQTGRNNKLHQGNQAAAELYFTNWQLTLEFL